MQSHKTRYGERETSVCRHRYPRSPSQRERGRLGAWSNGSDLLSSAAANFSPASVHGMSGRTALHSSAEVHWWFTGGSLGTKGPAGSQREPGSAPGSRRLGPLPGSIPCSWSQVVHPSCSCNSAGQTCRLAKINGAAAWLTRIPGYEIVGPLLISLPSASPSMWAVSLSVRRVMPVRPHPGGSASSSVGRHSQTSILAVPRCSGGALRKAHG